jgi:hypothetical protein
MIRNKLVKRYNKYYAHWKDVNVLVAVLAMIGLLMTFLTWDYTFPDRYNDPTFF